MHDQLSRGLLLLPVLRSRLDLLDESGHARNPVGTSPAAAEAQRRLLSWGSRVDLAEGSETGSSLSRSSPARSTAPPQGLEACSVVSFPRRESQTLHLSSFRPPFLPSFLPSYLSPSSALSLKAPNLPTRPVRLTSVLVGKAYTAAGQAGAYMHAMAVLQAYQAKHQEKCAFSTTENHLSGCGVGFDDDAGTSVSCSYRCDSHSRKESERRPVTHCQTVSETARSDGSCIQCDTFWPAVHETLAVVAQDQRVFPKGQL